MLKSMHREEAQLQCLALNRKAILRLCLLLLWMSLNACSVANNKANFEPSWMQYDQDKKQAHFELISAWNAKNNGYNFNGFYQDEIIISVPADWLINIKLINYDANAPHSIVVSEPYSQEDIPDELSGEFAVIKRAYTDELYANESAEMRFKAIAGQYWLFCGVKNHGIDNMWLRFNVEKNISVPRLKILSPTTDYRH